MHNDPAAAVGELLDYWFDVDVSDPDALKEQMRCWFMSTAAEDEELAERFGELAHAAARGELDELAATPRLRLALIILLDQFPRNLHRGSPAAFAQDDKALSLTIDGIEDGQLDALSPLERIFFCMPLQHSESREVQARSIDTFEALAADETGTALGTILRNTADYAALHRDIVDRFGRFPHRNETLGRQSTAAESEFLESGGPSFGQ